MKLSTSSIARLGNFSNLIPTISSSKLFQEPVKNWRRVFYLCLVPTDLAGPTPPIYRSILVSLRLPSAATNRFGFIAGFPDPYLSAKLFMSLPSKARDFFPGLISLTGVNARKENLITAVSAPWHSSRPKSLTMNPSISTPSQKEPLPLHRLDGSPQTLEGTDAQRWARRFQPQRALLPERRPWARNVA